MSVFCNGTVVVHVLVPLHWMPLSSILTSASELDEEQGSLEVTLPVLGYLPALYLQQCSWLIVNRASLCRYATHETNLQKQ